MKKILKFTPLVLALLFLSTKIFADTPVSFQDLFTPNYSDISFLMLGNIFGHMHGILRIPETEQSLLGMMFQQFNDVILALATIIIMYTVFLSIINTAHQGKFLGEKLNSVWIPLRSVAGFALIIPTTSGYSMIQVFMMWVIVQGIWAADGVWGKVATLLSSSDPKQFIVANQAPLPTYVKISSSILFSTICMYNSYMGLSGIQEHPFTSLTVNNTNMYYTTNINPAPPPKSKTPPISENKNYYVYNFECYYPPASNSPTASVPLPDCRPYNTDQGPQGYQESECGFTYWIYDTPLTPEKQYEVDQLNQGIPPIINALLETAREFVLEGSEAATPNNDNPIVDTALELSEIAAAIQNYNIQNLQPSGEWLNSLTLGWADAGAYYYDIARINNDTASQADLSQVQHQPGGDPYYADDTVTGSSLLPNSPKAFVDNLSNVAETSPQISPTGLPYTDPGVRNIVGHSGFMAMINWITLQLAEPFIKMVTGHTSTGKTYGPQDLQKLKSPIFEIQRLGTNIVDTVEIFWGIALLLTGVAGFLMGICGAVNPLTAMYGAAVRIIVVPVMFLLGTLFAVGLTMKVYIPLVPYIIFTFGVIGWFVAVVETMIAAPLVALGITHPEGHEVYGRAEPAIMMITNVFLRPTLMIFFLIIAMVLSELLVYFVNSAFSAIIGTSEIKGNTEGGIEIVLYLVIYLSLVITIINKVYALVTSGPDNVLTWIGNQRQFGSDYGQAEREVREGFSGGAKAAQSGFQATAQSTEGDAKDHQGAFKDKQRKKNADKKAATPPAGTGKIEEDN